MAKKRPEGEHEEEGLSDSARAMQGAAPWVGAVWKFIGGTAVGVIAGYFLDKRLGTTPWILVGLTVVGTVVGFYGFLHDVNRLGQKKK